MVVPKTPENENERLEELQSYSILDTSAESEYDDITLLASEICQTPISLLSLIDDKRQWFKSKQGLEPDETHRDLAFCAHAINDKDQILEVPDSRLDERFFDNPLVTGDPHVVFYTGVPLISPKGYALGTLCVIDNIPKKLTLQQLKALKALSNQIVSLLELRKHKLLLEKNKQELELQNEELENFARVVAHDIKSPLSNISGLSQLLLRKASSSLDQEGLEILHMLDTSALQVIDLVNGILEHSRSTQLLQETRSWIKVSDLLNDTTKLIDSQNGVQFNYPDEVHSIFVNKIALQQILINLITNGIKYNDKEQVIITMGFEETDTHYQFFVKDNGIGIPAKHLDHIFKMFGVVTGKDRFGHRGNGIGLSTVKKLVGGMGGTIQVSSEVNKGTRFEFNISRS